MLFFRVAIRCKQPDFVYGKLNKGLITSYPDKIIKQYLDKIIKQYLDKIIKQYLDKIIKTAVTSNL